MLSAYLTLRLMSSGQVSQLGSRPAASLPFIILYHHLIRMENFVFHSPLKLIWKQSVSGNHRSLGVTHKENMIMLIRVLKSQSEEYSN
jgi:hypothetical protein